MKADPDAFDCGTCERRLQEAGLDDLNERAIALHGLLARRAVQELRITRLVFDILRLRLPRPEALALLDQLCLVHDARCPAEAAPEIDFMKKDAD